MDAVMASGDLSLTSTSSPEGSHEFGAFRNSTEICSATNHKTCDQLKRQYDQGDMKNMKEDLDYYRKQYIVAMQQLETSTQESSGLRTQYAELSRENISLRQRIHKLESEHLRFLDLLKQNNENGNVIENNSTVCAFVEEYNKLKIEKAEIERDRNSLALEKDNLKQQLSNACKHLEESVRDKGNYRRARDKLIQQHEIDLKELKKVVTQKNNAELDLQKILAERKDVLEENQKLSDELGMAKEELNLNYKATKQMTLEHESLKQEIERLLISRDDILKKYNMAREKYSDLETKLLKRRPESVIGGSDLSVSKDKFGNEQISLDLEAANQEISILRKQLEYLKNDVTKATQETEIAKGRRDWAISEREKIVQERDSVKILCDELRKERDTAISELLAAIRDSDKIKKQKDEACREVEQLREKVDQLQATKLKGRNTRWSMVSYEETEIVELDTSRILSDGDLGLELEGHGRDELKHPGSGVFVADISPDSIAYGKLKVNDLIVQVNNLNCANASKCMILETIRSSIPRCTIVVRRPQINQSHVYAVELSTNRNHGLSFEMGVFISNIAEASVADQEADFTVGDRILSINSKAMNGIKTINDALACINDNRVDSITIIALKHTNPHQSDLNRSKFNKSNNMYTQTDDSSDLENNGSRNISVGSTNSKSTSKLTEMISKLKKFHIHGYTNHKGSTASESDSLTQVSDAIKMLDSVLNNENSASSSSGGKSKDTMTNLFKRQKKTKKESIKEINKAMGTWPRANAFSGLKSGDAHPGTIVQPRTKQRPALSIFPDAFTTNSDKTDGRKSQSNNDKYLPFHQPKSPTPIVSHASQPTQSTETNRSSFAFITESEKDRDHIPAYSSIYNNGNNSGFNTVIYRNPRNKAVPKASTIYGHHFHPLNSLKYPMNRYSYDSSKLPMFHNQKHSYEELMLGQNKVGGPMVMVDHVPKSVVEKLDMQRDIKPDVLYNRGRNSNDSILTPKSPNSLEYVAEKPLPNKYLSDSDSIGMEIISLSSDSPRVKPNISDHPSSRLLGTNKPLYLGSNYNHLHSKPLYIHHSGMNLTNSADKLEMEFTGSGHYHSHGISMDATTMKHATRDRHNDMSSYPSSFTPYSFEGGGTIPRKKDNSRCRIPSNQSVTSRSSGIKNSTGSIEHHGSERGSPMPTAHVEVLSHGANKRNSMPDYYGQKPSPGDLRRVTIEKTVEPLGITICCNNNGGGVFVSTVTYNSIASQVGLQIGDQLLEVCGINMRNATYDLAKSVLRQCGDSITMLVQYSPDKYEGNIVQMAGKEDGISHSGSTTPRNSPKPCLSIIAPNSATLTPKSSSLQQQFQPSTTSNQQNSNLLIPVSQDKNMMSSQLDPNILSGYKKSNIINKFNDSLEMQSDLSQMIDEFSDNTSIYSEEAPRVITMHTKKCPNLGIRLIGGNAVGIYVHDIDKGSIADNAGFRIGDQILEYNGSNLRNVTAEQAAREISKPAEKVTVVVQHNIQKFHQIKDEEGDSLYIRVGFDRTGDLADGELRFCKDDVLYVDNTIFRSQFGQWRAWKLDEYGHRLECGIIPSQSKVEEEMRLLGDLVETDGPTRRNNTSARRSFFRRKKHQRSSSRDSKELASFSNTQLSWFSDSGMLSEEGSIPYYQHVERLDYSVCRPVLILGPLAECVAEKLPMDFPQLFQRCQPISCTFETIEKNLQSNIFIDYRRRGSIYEYTTVQSIRDICNKNRHCILDVCISAVERLHRQNIFPIVLLLRFKSAKQIKEIKDSRYSVDKISAKAAKEMYEHALKLEVDYRQLISAVIPAGVNITHMSTQIKAAVDEEKTKVLWVPVPGSNA